ncbi:hypothetical protein FHR55_004024 [Xanthomonas arboricola]
MFCSSEKRFFTSNLLRLGNWTPNYGDTQNRGGASEGDDEDSDWHQWVWTHVIEPANGALDFYFEHQRLLLEAAARRGAPAAHLSIAKLLESEAVGFGDEDERVRRRVKRGGTWTSPFVSFVDSEANGLRIEEKYRYHLLAAARGGDMRALMETAERYGDPAILGRPPSAEMDPMSMIDIASEYGDQETVRWANGRCAGRRHRRNARADPLP